MTPAVQQRDTALYSEVGAVYSMYSYIAVQTGYAPALLHIATEETSGRKDTNWKNKKVIIMAYDNRKVTDK